MLQSGMILILSFPLPQSFPSLFFFFFLFLISPSFFARSVSYEDAQADVYTLLRWQPTSAEAYLSIIHV